MRCAGNRNPNIQLRNQKSQISDFAFLARLPVTLCLQMKEGGITSFLLQQFFVTANFQ